MRTRTRALFGAAAVLAAAASALAVWADEKGIICWLDDRGQRACGDHVPPQYARKEREIYDHSGVLVQTLKAEDTPEQRAEGERKALEAQRAQDQQKKDKFMLQTYRNVNDLKAVRDTRLQSLDTRLELVEKSLHDGEITLKDLQDRVDSERTAGGNPSPELLGQIKSFESSQAENVRAVTQIKQDRDATAEQFERDIRRYQELHGAATATPPPAPQAPQPAQAPSASPAPKP